MQRTTERDFLMFPVRNTLVFDHLTHEPTLARNPRNLADSINMFKVEVSYCVST